jgi:hypothetical protein
MTQNILKNKAPPVLFGSSTLLDVVNLVAYRIGVIGGIAASRQLVSKL